MPDRKTSERSYSPDTAQNWRSPDVKAIRPGGGKPHVPPSPEPDLPGHVPGQDLPGQDDDPLLAPLQERSEHDALRHLREEGPRHKRVPPPGTGN